MKGVFPDIYYYVWVERLKFFEEVCWFLSPIADGLDFHRYVVYYALISVEKEFSGGREAKGVLIYPGNRNKKATVYGIRFPVLWKNEGSVAHSHALEAS